ncbi:MAG: PEP-CTERM sorting domain-containing protein [Myxococcota bacterium]|nr:PEP-CTERM sorting domain-containing protein [Myxococcota bacterium]
MAAAVALLASGSSSALQASLDLELYEGMTGTFATVDITEDAGALDFTITLDSSLGEDRDLQTFYFNFVGDPPDGLLLTTTDDPQTPYTLLEGPHVYGAVNTLPGTEGHFDYGVAFGSGPSNWGNGTLQTASFSLMAESPLQISDLFESTAVIEGTADVQLALRAQSTDIVEGLGASSSSFSVVGGNIVPEPSSGLMASLGLVGLALRRRSSLRVVSRE